MEAWTDEETAALYELLDELKEYDKDEYAQAVLHLALLEWHDLEEVYALLPGHADVFAFGRLRDWGFKIRRRHVGGRTQYMIDVRRRSGRDSSGSDPGVSGSDPGAPFGGTCARTLCALSGERLRPSRRRPFPGRMSLPPDPGASSSIFF